MTIYMYIYIYIRYSTALEKSFFQNLEVSEEPNSVKLVKIGLFLKESARLLAPLAMSDDNEIPMQLLLVPVRTSSKAIAEFRNRRS